MALDLAGARPRRAALGWVEICGVLMGGWGFNV